MTATIDNSAFERLDNGQILALVMWGEARGEPVEGRIAVGNVVRNRSRKPGWWGRDIRSVCLSAKQFSCFNPADPNREKILQLAGNASMWTADPVLRECLYLASGISVGIIRDNTAGATHYHAVGCNPAWAKVMVLCGRYGNHLFYKEG